MRRIALARRSFLLVCWLSRPTIDSAGAVLLCPGDRSGNVLLWDTDSGTSSLALRGAHKGHVTALQWFDLSSEDADLLLSGGQDGTVKVWDTRSGGGAVSSQQLHANQHGVGAVGDICAGGVSNKKACRRCNGHAVLLPTAEAMESTPGAGVRGRGRNGLTPGWPEAGVGVYVSLLTFIVLSYRHGDLRMPCCRVARTSE